LLNSAGAGMVILDSAGKIDGMILW